LAAHPLGWGETGANRPTRSESAAQFLEPYRIAGDRKDRRGPGGITGDRQDHPGPGGIAEDRKGHRRSGCAGSKDCANVGWLSNERRRAVRSGCWRFLSGGRVVSYTALPYLFARFYGSVIRGLESRYSMFDPITWLDRAQKQTKAASNVIEVVNRLLSALTP
jgi:hypothetical protein